MQIMDTDDDGQIIIRFDSRWKDPSLLGYEPSSPQYKCLRELWLKITNSDKEEDYNEKQQTTQTERE